MNNIKILLFLFFSSFSFSQVEIPVIDFASGDYPIGEKVKILYDKDFKPVTELDSADFYRIINFKKKNIPSGKIEDYHITGELRSTFYSFYAGLDSKGIDSIALQNGPEIKYFLNGKKKIFKSFFDGMQVGNETHYYSSGEKETVYNISDGLREGKGIGYYNTGELFWERKYINGLVQGEQNTYYKSGVLKWSVNSVDDLRQGKRIEYYKSGEIKSEIVYADNLIQGQQNYYYESGEIEYTQNYIDGLKQGKQFGYYESGELESTVNYLDNLIQGDYIGYYKSEKKKYSIKWINSKKEGERIDYYESGEIQITINYIDDLAQGKQVFYLENGEVDYTKLWIDGEIKERRIALVIGNAAYLKGPLENPVNDANLIAESLEKLDFEVFLHTDLATEDEMLDAIKEFGRKRKNYEIAFVYYAGHGIQLNNENYLLPVKEEFEFEDDVEDNGVSMQRVLRYLESTRENQLNFIVLDACRDNPFESNWNKTRSLKGAGLAKTPPPTGSLIAFSTDHGQTAADGDGGNSLYSQALAEKLLEENVSIEQVFKNVRTEVLKLSGDTQSPVEESKLTGDAFYLNKTKI